MIGCVVFTTIVASLVIPSLRSFVHAASIATAGTDLRSGAVVLGPVAQARKKAEERNAEGRRQNAESLIAIALSAFCLLPSAFVSRLLHSAFGKTPGSRSPPCARSAPAATP